MTIVVGQRSNRGRRSDLVLTALCRELGGMELVRDYPSGINMKLYIQWGYKQTKLLDEAIAQKAPILFVDMGHFTNRNEAISLSFNGFQADSLELDGLDDLPRRPHPPLQAMRREGSRVYIYGQLPGDKALRGLNVSTWMRHAAREVQQAASMPVVLREHPKCLSSWELPEYPSLESTFEETALAIAYTSTATTLAAIGGVPTVACHKANPAYEVSFHSIDDAMSYYKDEGHFVCSFPIARIVWVNRLAQTNYTLNEIRQAARFINWAMPQAQEDAYLDNYRLEGLR